MIHIFISVLLFSISSADAVKDYSANTTYKTHSQEAQKNNLWTYENGKWVKKRDGESAENEQVRVDRFRQKKRPTPIQEQENIPNGRKQIHRMEMNDMGNNFAPTPSWNNNRNMDNQRQKSSGATNQKTINRIKTKMKKILQLESNLSQEINRLNDLVNSAR